MIDVIKKFYEKRNLRPFECTWLLAVHVLSIIGLVYAFIDYTLIPKILLTHCIFHNLYALGITTGAHRLWSHKAYKATNLWKAMIMILNSGNFSSYRRGQSRINLPLEQRSQTSSQIFWYLTRSTHYQQRILLRPRRMALS